MPEYPTGRTRVPALHEVVIELPAGPPPDYEALVRLMRQTWPSWNGGYSTVMKEQVVPLIKKGVLLPGQHGLGYYHTGLRSEVHWIRGLTWTEVLASLRTVLVPYHLSMPTGLLWF